ncbi:MAG TPA: ABC transporter ATP-binding protein [Bacteroidota bacterium]|nr:ABC transporter ATP-binding protein [Bacteroidota bacterium]
MTTLHFEAQDITKEFNRKRIVEHISFDLHEGQSLALVGRNGAGKSTVAKILCGLLSPTRGTVALSVNGTPAPYPAHLYPHIGFVAPYINLYDEFTGLENLQLCARLRNYATDPDGRASRLLKQFSLFEKRNDELRTYSSGMKQRLKYCAALLHEPPLLVLDEPCANLDEEGIAVVREVMTHQKRTGILIIATNDRDDLSYADSIVTVERVAQS